MNPTEGLSVVTSIQHKLICFFVLSVVGVCTLVLSVNGSDEGRVELYVTDALTFPSKPVQLQARLTKHLPGGEQGLEKEPVEFALQGHVLGTATTDTDGWARLEFAPKMRGNLSLSAKWTTTTKADVVQGRGVVLSWERRRPILLIDLAVLVEEMVEADVPRPGGYPDPGLILGQPSEAAPAELSKLSKFYYNLVYLDRTGRGRLEAIQVWLRAQEFPPGMIRVLPQSSTALPDLLASLKEEGWENVSGGIGRTSDFANVLAKNRLKTIILPFPDYDEQFPRRAIVLNDWSRVRRHL